MNKQKLAMSIIMGLVLIGGASAVLVSYLSNTVTTTASVTTPLTISDLGAIPTSIPAGSSVSFTTTVSNAANNPVNGMYTLTVNNTDGITCDDFSSATIDSNALTCTVVSPSSITLTSSTMSFVANGNSPSNTWDLTIQSNAAGTYNLGLQVTP